MIEHTSPHCTGHWRMQGTGNERRVECDRCAASGTATQENRTVAIAENYVAATLVRLAREGWAQLLDERGLAED